MSNVELVDHGGWVEVVLDRPPMNQLSAQMEEDLRQFCLDVSNETRWRALVITSGAENFCVGADLSEFLANAEATYEPRLGSKGQDHFSSRLTTLRVPTIAAIDGYCLGGGLEIALCCDLRIASPNARFGFPEVRLGLFPGMGGTQRGPRLIGPEHAKRLIFTGDYVGAEQALAMGIVGEIADDPKAAAVTLVGRIVRNGPRAIEAAKRCVERGLDLGLEVGLDLEQVEWARIWDDDERREGVQAFLNKRTPSFAMDISDAT